MTRIKAGILVVLGLAAAVVFVGYFAKIGLIVPGVLVAIIIGAWIMPQVQTVLDPTLSVAED